MVKVHGSLICPPFLYSILLYYILHLISGLIKLNTSADSSSEEAEDTDTVHLGTEVGIPLTNQLVDTLSTSMAAAYLAPLQP